MVAYTKVKMAVLVLALGCVGSGMLARGQVQGVGPDGRVFATTQQFSHDTTMGDLKIPAGVTLEQAIEILRKTRPDFSAVIVRLEGADEERPVLPAIELRNVSPAEIADVLSRVLADTVVTTNGKAFFFHIAPIANGRTVRVFSLMDVAQARGPKGLEAAVSLVKAALEQAGGTKAGIQVHEETAAVIVKGTRDQIDAVQGAVNALGPGKSAVEAEKVGRRIKELEERSAQLQIVVNEAKEQVRQRVEQTAQQAASSEELQKSNQRLQERAANAESQVRDQTREIVRLQTQLEEVQKKLNAKQ